VGSLFRFREDGTTSSISVVSCSGSGSGECSDLGGVLPCANREREERVLLRDAGESDVALRILEVSLEIREVLILTAEPGDSLGG